MTSILENPSTAVLDGVFASAAGNQGPHQEHTMVRIR